MQGNVAIALNAHFPYVRNAGQWPHGEEALHAVLAESYVPLLAMLLDLQRAGTTLPLTLAISPVLLEQLAAPRLIERAVQWMQAWRDRAEHDHAQFITANKGHDAYLARFYLDWIDSVRNSLLDRFNGDLLRALRNALPAHIELLLSPATYAYLPHLPAAAVRAQLKAGALAVVRHLGRRPTGVWLPGGGIGGVDPQLQLDLGLRCAVSASQPRGWWTGDVPLVVADHVLAEHVTTPALGYGGDGLYREFYRRHPDSGIAYWRVTSTDTPLEHKAAYDPYLAFSRADEHAEHFVHAIVQRLHSLRDTHRSPALLLAFDAELFGHWWFEGVHWLRRVLEQIRQHDTIRLVNVGQLGAMPAHAGAETSVHPLFDDPIVAPLRQHIRAITERFVDVATRYGAAEGTQEALLNQAAREVLLLQASDWAALIATDAAADYAERRVREHTERFERLLDLAEHAPHSADAASYLRHVAALDDLFPFLNYRVFA